MRPSIASTPISRAYAIHAAPSSSKGVAISVDEFLQAMRVHCKSTFGDLKQRQAIDAVVANVRGTP
jgi:hypothetical protein